MTAPRISLCVITGNEAPAVERFLNSFSGAFDELCMVRAIGNQEHDKTLSLAKAWCASHLKGFRAGEYANATNHHAIGTGGAAIDELNPATWPHVDDFAAARNMAWSLATCPWQFWADLDDILAEGAELIRLCAAAGAHDQYLFKYDLRGQSESNVRERLFRTGVSRWVQPVHEQCRFAIAPTAATKNWKGLIEERVIFEHAPQANKQRDPMRNRRIMSYHVRWIHTYAFELHKEWFYQWQAARKPEDAEAATKWAEIAHNTDCLPEQRFDMVLHQAQIASYSDLEHAIDLCWSAIRINPKNRDAWGDLAQYELRAGRGPRADVMTAFMQSVPKPQSSGYPTSTRYHGWEGLNLRLMSLRAAGSEKSARESEIKIFADYGQKISLLHATRGRPQKAIEARDMWLKAAFNPLSVEHIFAIDSDDTESLRELKNYRHVVVEQANGCVKAWNEAAAASSGHVLVQLSDDWIPCIDWDDIIWETLADAAAKRLQLPDGGTEEEDEAMAKAITDVSLVLAISDNHRTDDLLCMAICTRTRYLEQIEVDGKPYLFAPEYFGVFSDNEFTYRAHRDGVVVPAKHIVFDHRHPIFEGKPETEWDATHLRQNAPSRYAEGKAIFERRNPDAVKTP